MNDPKLDSMIGLARRAGCLALGTTAMEMAVKRRKAFLVILADDLSANSRESIERLCRRNNIPWFNYADRTHLGHIVGREARAVMAVTSQDFAAAIRRLIPAEE